MVMRFDANGPVFFTLVWAVSVISRVYLHFVRGKLLEAGVFGGRGGSFGGRGGRNWEWREKLRI